MSYFLEDTKTTGYNTTVLVDYTGINESLFNAEVAWSNIMESAMKAEYTAIKNESQIMLESAVGDFFTKVKEWFKNMITSIGRVITNIKNKIILKFNMYEKFANKAAPVLRKIKTDKFTSLKVPACSVSTDIAAQAAKTMSTFAEKSVQVIKTDDPDFEKRNQVVAAMTKAYRLTLEEISSNEKKASQVGIPVKTGVDTALKFAASLKPYCDGVKEAMKICNIGIDEAKKGVKEADKKDKDAVKSAKLNVTIANRTSSMTLNINMKVANIMVSYIKMILRKTKGSDSDAQRQKDYDKAMGITDLNSAYYGF